jgi:hypothetical protein
VPKLANRSSTRPKERVDIGAQVMTGNTGDPLDIQNAADGRLTPLRDGLRRDAKSVCQFGDGASPTDGIQESV